MKKVFLSIGIIVLSILILVVKVIFFTEFAEELELYVKSEIIQNIENTKNTNIYEKDFGTYRLPDGWVESKDYSMEDKFFYTLEGDEYKERPNNISVNEGNNRYSELNHNEFKEAILRQLYMQVGENDHVTINADGLHTDNNYIVYKFVIYEEDENITTIQYYIVGNYKYVLVHETVFGESEETDKAAKEIVNSFKWD